MTDDYAGVIGGHFSRDFDDDSYDGMVSTEDGVTVALAGGVHYYITCRLLDFARMSARTATPDITFVKKYYPWVESLPAEIKYADILPVMTAQSRVSGYAERVAERLAGVAATVYQRVRENAKTRLTGRIPDAPPARTADLYTWLQHMTAWAHSIGVVTPVAPSRPPKEGKPPAPVQITSDVITTMKRAIQNEVELAKYLSDLEDWYITATRYMLDLTSILKKSATTSHPGTTRQQRPSHRA